MTKEYKTITEISDTHLRGEDRASGYMSSSRSELAEI